VVSAPAQTSGGVVQYDLGKAGPGGEFDHTGALNSPPNFLLAQLRQLNSDRDFPGGGVPKYLSDMFCKHPYLKANYGHPSDNDSTVEGHLYKAKPTCHHVRPDSPEDPTCPECGSSRTVHRRHR
jgi:hypothetical protein